MANFSGCKGYPIERLGSYVDWDEPHVLPLGVSPLVKNCRFKPESVAMRYGTQTTMQASAEITGLTCINFNADTYIEVPLQFDLSGKLAKEYPVGSGTMVDITSAQLTLPGSARMTAAQAYNRAYLAFSDYKNARHQNAVYDPKTGYLDPISGRPFGEPWVPDVYEVGEVVSPSTPNGHLYRVSAITTGISAASEPTWPTVEGDSVTDGGVTYTEMTPQFGIVALPPVAPTIAQVATAGTFAAGRDVYIVVTLKSPAGETTISPSSKITNTVLNDRVTVTSPVLPNWLSTLGASYKPNEYKVYEADVATGATAPASTVYKLVATTAIGTPTNVDTTAAGAAPPTVNNCLLSDLNGNICAGTRNAVIFFKNRNGYYTAAAEAAIMTAEIPSFGYRIWMGNIPIGPANTIARVIAFNVAEGGSAGQFFFIGEDDSPNGLLQTATVIPNNTDTSAYFTFDDQYLPTANDVTDFTSKIQVPPCKAICYSRSFRKMVYVSPIGYEAGFLISDTDDPESVTGDTSYITPGDSQDVPVGWVEMRGNPFALKSESAHAVSPSDQDPSLWATKEWWNGSGPAGPLAYDKVGSSPDDANQFMIYAHRSSPYRWTGQDPVPINMENPKLWARINWEYGHLICVKIDDDNKEVHFAVPLDGATKNTHVLTINYRTGWSEPLHFSSFSGKWVAPPESRKWSVNDYPSGVNVMAIMKRKLVDPPDARIATQQFLLGCQDGKTRMAVPDTITDDGAAIDQQYQSAYGKEEDLAVLRYAGVTVRASGQGTLNLIPQNVDGQAAPTVKHDFVSANANQFDEQFRGEGEHFGILFTNGSNPEGDSADPNSAFELNNLVMWGNRKWKSRRG